MSHRKKLLRLTLFATFSLLILAGCGSAPLVFLNRSYDFNYIERVAVIPFENLSQTQGTGEYATLMFITQLLATETFDVVEPGETVKALNDLSLARTNTLSVDQIVALGNRLKVQALIFGTVGESTTTRSGSVAVPTVSMDVRMVETEKGTTVWSAAYTYGHPSLWSSLFGTAGKSTSETMKGCIHGILKTLIK
jgi:TolB-like protein